MRRNSRKSNMNTAKLGVIFIIIAMALAGVGAGYSAWFDTITVEGTVGTGSVGWDVTDYSGTWVWKNMANDQIEITHEGQIVQDTCILVAAAYAEQTVDVDGALVDDSVTVVFDNLFPCIDFEADFTVHYTGTVPGKINKITFRDLWPDTADELLIDKFTTLEVTIKKSGTDVWIPLPIEDLDGYQLHYCDYIHIVMTIHLPQYYDLDGDGVEEPTDDLMDLTGSFDLDVEVVQWNEYPYDGGECGEDPPIGHHADVMLCLDRSGSIAYDPLDPPIVRAAAQGFISALLVADDGMVGVASFASLGSLDHALSTNIVTLHQAIDDLVFMGGTNLADGMYYARTELEPTNDRTPDSDYPDYMVIITDGDPNVPDEATAIAAAEAEAVAAKTHGITIFVFGIGDSLTPTTRAWLQNTIATSPAHYYEGDWSALATLLEGLI